MPNPVRCGRCSGCDDARLNHRCEIHQGVLGEECAQQLSLFFKKLRDKRKAEKDG